MGARRVDAQTNDASGYWYAGEGVDASAVEVLNLLRRYRETET